MHLIRNLLIMNVNESCQKYFYIIYLKSERQNHINLRFQLFQLIVVILSCAKKQTYHRPLKFYSTCLFASLLFSEYYQYLHKIITNKLQITIIKFESSLLFVIIVNEFSRSKLNDHHFTCS